MNCTNRKVRDLIFDYIDGNLEVEAQRQVEEHLAVCEDCRSLEREYRHTIDETKAFFAKSAMEHIANETLVEYVDSPQKLTRSQREAVEFHLDICPTCSGKIKMLERVATESSPGVPKVVTRGFLDCLRGMGEMLMRRPAVAFATAAVILAIAIPLGYIIRSQMAGGVKVEFVQAADVVWLHELQRSDLEKPLVERKDGWVQIGLTFDTFFDDESYILELQSAEGEVLFKKKLSESDFTSHRGLVMRVKTQDIAPGEYLLILVASKTATPEEEYRTIYPFILGGV